MLVLPTAVAMLLKSLNHGDEPYLKYAQSGLLVENKHAHTTKRSDSKQYFEPTLESPPYYISISTLLGYLILIVVGKIRDGLDALAAKPVKDLAGFAPLLDDYDSFIWRRIKARLDDCFSRPVTGVPGRFVTLLDRTRVDQESPFTLTGGTTTAINISSYNYLGFAQTQGTCADAVEKAVWDYGMSTTNQATELNIQVENEVAAFVGKPAAMIFSMGFATNSIGLPALVNSGCLVISDELNHSSIRFGLKVSGATVKSFKHNDMKSLESLLRKEISRQSPPWKRIMVVVEGLYSMEGTMCNLPGIIALKKRYKFHLYIDEAHSIGAIGPRGRGVCDYFGIDPAEVELLMGTFSKSFGGVGGYIAGSKDVISTIRSTTMDLGEPMSPPILMQISTSLQIIAGDLDPGNGEERLKSLAFNSWYLRSGLKKLGFIVYGDEGSPVVPLLVFNTGKLPALSREMLKRKIAIVVVAYPATPMILARARFCVSAAHTKEDLDHILTVCDELGDLLDLKLSRVKYSEPKGVC